MVVSVDCYNYNEATATTTVWESILIFLGSIIYLRVRQHNACGVVLSAFFAKAKNDCIQNLMLPYAALDQISLRLGFSTSPYSRLTKFGSKKFIPVSENKFSSTHKFFGTSSSAALAVIFRPSS